MFVVSFPCSAKRKKLAGADSSSDDSVLLDGQEDKSTDMEIEVEEACGRAAPAAQRSDFVLVPPATATSTFTGHNVPVKEFLEDEARMSTLSKNQKKKQKKKARQLLSGKGTREDCIDIYGENVSGRFVYFLTACQRALALLSPPVVNWSGRFIFLIMLLWPCSCLTAFACPLLRLRLFFGLLLLF